MVHPRRDQAAFFVMLAVLGAMVVVPFLMPADPPPAESERYLGQGTHHRKAPAPGAQANTPSGSESEDTETGESRKGQHGHDLPETAPHWYLTVHGGDDLADVFALDAKGRVIGGILGKLPAGIQPLKELRGISLLGDGRLAVVNAFMQNSRVYVYGAPDAQGMRPFASTWVAGGPQNPGFMHPYQIAVGPNGSLYASNQDSNTVTRYYGLGSPQAGNPYPVPSMLQEFGTLPAGIVVPNSQHSPEGIHEVRGIAFGPDGLLYVADRSGHQVLKWDTATGRMMGVVMSAAQGLGQPIQLLFTPDRQSLLIGDNLKEHNCVWKLNLATGKAEMLVKTGAGGLNMPSALAIDGSHLYVGSRVGQSILKFNLADGTFVGEFAKLKGNPEFLIPVQQK